MKFLCLFSLILSTALHAAPNLVIIYCDDLGWGDLGCFGNPTIQTPHLDQMAAQGQKWTQFYVAAPVCTPSRAGLMTGRYPIRNGMTSAKRVVFFPDSGSGLLPEEVTIAEMLKEQGYATGMFGKWHLGHLPQFQPTNQGFDTYYGIPYSNDMDRISGPNYRKEATDPSFLTKTEHYNVPLIHDGKEIARPADQHTITKAYTEKTIAFIEANKDNPFFVYLPHSMPHIPLFASENFVGRSKRGLYGDVIEEIDWSVGQVLSTLRRLKLAENTMVMFCSDNGPWLTFKTHGGSAGPLRAGKGTTFEGGQRVPTIFWWPGTIPAASVVTDIGSATDMMATLATICGGKAPSDRTLDSLDLTPALKGTGESPRDDFFYWTRAELHAVRSGPWKLHLKQREPINYGRAVILPKPQLFHLEHDISEAYDVASSHPEIVAKLLAMADAHKAQIAPYPDQLIIRIPK
ncbi:MAG: arylsulfatase A [Rhodothermales bacterium]|jgi:arylsulfatase A